MNIAPLSVYDVDASYLIFPEPQTFYCMVGKQKSYSVSQEVCAVTSAKNYTYLLLGTSLSWAEIHANGTVICNATASSPSSLDMSYVISDSQTNYELVFGQLTLVVKT